MTLGDLVRDELRRRSGVTDVELVSEGGQELTGDDSLLLLTAKFKKPDGSDYFVCDGSPKEGWLHALGATIDSMVWRIKHEAAS